MPAQGPFPFRLPLRVVSGARPVSSTNLRRTLEHRITGGPHEPDTAHRNRRSGYRPAEQIQKKCTADSLQFDARFGAGQDVFDALTRRIDRIDPGYKT